MYPPLMCLSFFCVFIRRSFSPQFERRIRIMKNNNEDTSADFEFLRRMHKRFNLEGLLWLRTVEQLPALGLNV
jgi:hypothetical protein